MKKRIVTVVLLVVLTLGAFTTMSLANAPLPLFDPELVGKDDGGYGRPAYQQEYFVKSIASDKIVSYMSLDEQTARLEGSTKYDWLLDWLPISKAMKKKLVKQLDTMCERN